MSDNQIPTYPGAPGQPGQQPGYNPNPGTFNPLAAGMTTQPTQQVASARPQPIDDAHIDDLLRSMVEKGSSDLHIAVGIPPIVRVDGALVPLAFEKLSSQDTQRLIYDILTDEQIQRFETELELDFSYQLARIARFRVNAFRDKGNVALAFRQIPQKIPTLTDLNLPGILLDLTRLPRGLVLVTGPTGSGKSTTLAAMINQINTESGRHIITIEDPIEYLHNHRTSIINQREVGQVLESSRTLCAPPFAKTRTSSSLAKCAISKRCRWPSPPLKPVTLSSRRCTPTRPRPRSSASSTHSHPVSRSRCVFSCRTTCRQFSASS